MMNQKVLRELLSRYVDQLFCSGDTNGRYKTPLKGYQEQLEPLLRVAINLTRTFGRVEPSPAFARRLQNQLLEAAHQKTHLSSLGPAKKSWQRYNRQLLVGTTMGSLLSIAAVVAIARVRKVKRSKF
jgi:hypothetical protein